MGILWWLDNILLIGRDGGLIEIVLTVTLLKNVFVGDCFADQHTENSSVP